VRGDGKIEHLEGTGMILGILPQGTYQQRTCPVNPGDTLVFFSDGVTEAARLDTDEEFGEERLATVVNQHRHQTAEQIANAILETVNEFTTGSPLADDMTLMVARREPLVPRALEVHSAHWRSNR
jgi:sigma-B regulation protein RsbU (phosphoserine phosphatase)